MLRDCYLWRRLSKCVNGMKSLILERLTSALLIFVKLLLELLENETFLHFCYVTDLYL